MSDKLDEIIQRLEQIDERLALIESIISPIPQDSITEREFDTIQDFFRFVFGDLNFGDFEGYRE
tara:strand:- start:693 stop:884 length:192 start_codon:yes stop_codon:yes gene_type:complete